MTTLEQLGPLPPITVELNLFDYVPLDSPREPPPVELRARLARSYDTDEEDVKACGSRSSPAIRSIATTF
jgi:hypothetical protein